MADTVSDINKEIAKLEQQKSELLKKKELLDSLSFTEKLAIELHTKMCKWNHTDGCEWHYHKKHGIPTWDCKAQQDYLNKSQRLIAWYYNNTQSKLDERAFDDLCKLLDII